MKILEETKLLLRTELPHCKSHEEVRKLFTRAQVRVSESNAPFGQKQLMWEEVKTKLSTMSRRPEIVNDAHAILDSILKRKL